MVIHDAYEIAMGVYGSMFVLKYSRWSSTGIEGSLRPSVGPYKQGLI